MENENRPRSLKGWIVVIVALAVLILIGYSMNLNYTRKARTSEVPGSLKEITKMQLAFREDPMSGNGRYASTIGSIGWVTCIYTYGDMPRDCTVQPKSLSGVRKINSGSNTGEYKWACGKYFAYGASDKDTCDDETTGALGIGKAVSYAAPGTADPAADFPDDWQTGACMNLKLELHHK